MNTLNPKVDAYLSEGCGRCKLFATPKCKVNSWRTELEMLRDILLKTPLVEDLKWGNPCYTFEGRNVLMIGAFKESCVMSFFKGALLKDPYNIMEKPGENSRTFKLFRFTEAAQIKKLKSQIKEYILEAIDLEKSGAKIEYSKEKSPLPAELKEVFKKDAVLKEAFGKLTPGRQRGYVIFISGAKQSATRLSRIEKCRKNILAGKGFDGR
jgi:uncharacterized protein YdeI (YjbR/CyaY-like superfamily)